VFESNLKIMNVMREKHRAVKQSETSTTEEYHSDIEEENK
jgi:hypothetical protein